MSPVATVLYEDRMQVGAGATFPLHDLILKWVANQTERPLWELQKLVDKNPRNGVSKLLGDVPKTSRIAGGGCLILLVDRDHIAEHVHLQKNAPDQQVIEAILRKSDAPQKLTIYFLHPNMEGMLSSIEDYDPTLPAPLKKDPNARDIILKKARTRPAHLRDCVRSRQPGIAALTDKLIELCRARP